MTRAEFLAEQATEQAALELQRQANLTQIENIRVGMSKADYEKACADILAALGGRNQ